MEIKSVTNSNYSNNSTSFGALKKSAVDVFKKKMEGLDVESQNVVLEELITLAKRAQESDVLDIASGRDVMQGGENKLVFEYSNNGKYGGYSAIPLEFDKFEKTPTGEVVVTAESGGFVCFKYENGKHQASVKDFFKTLTNLFNTREESRIKELDDKKRNRDLSEKLNKFLKD